MVHAVILFVGGVAGQIHAQLFQGIGIDTGEDDGGMDIAALQVGDLEVYKRQQVSLTSVFGMGTGGTSPSSTPAIYMTNHHASLFL